MRARNLAPHPINDDSLPRSGGGNARSRGQAFTVGQVVRPATLGHARGESARTTSSSLTIRTPAGKQSVTPTTAALTLDEPGFYEVRRDAITATAAVNVDRVESDLTRLVPEEFAASVAGEPGAPSTSAGPTTPEDEERRAGFWWYLLLAALALLTLETVLANRLAPTRS